MRISDWSSDVCSSDLSDADRRLHHGLLVQMERQSAQNPKKGCGTASCCPSPREGQCAKVQAAHDALSSLRQRRGRSYGALRYSVRSSAVAKEGESFPGVLDSWRPVMSTTTGCSQQAGAPLRWQRRA